MWRTVRLDEICSLVTKGTTPTSAGFRFQDDGINFIKIESIDENSNFIKSKFAKIDEECHASLRRSQLMEGDVLFSIAGALGRTAVVTKEILPANTNQALAILRIKPEVEVDKKYLLHVLNSEATKAQSNVNKGGVAQLNLSLSQLKNYFIIIPPLAEQQRIVEKLDRAFAEIDRAIDATVSSLEAALTGLSNSIDAKTAKKLDWTEYKVSDLGIVQTGTTPKTAQTEYYGYDIPFVKPPHFRADGVIVTSEDGLTYLGAKASRIAKANSVLMVCIGATIGKVGVCQEDICFNQQINSLTPQSNYDAELIYWQMRGNRFQYDVRRRAGQATLPIISKAKWADLRIFLPNNLEEQVRIRNELRHLSNSTDGYCRSKKLKLEELRKLKSAILKQALQPLQQ
jgi:type I restriction enzyme S subunit